MTVIITSEIELSMITRVTEGFMYGLLSDIFRPEVFNFNQLNLQNYLFYMKFQISDFKFQIVKQLSLEFGIWNLESEI